MTPERDWPRLFSIEARDTSTSSRTPWRRVLLCAGRLPGRPERGVREQPAAQIAPRLRTIRGPGRVRRTPSSGHGLRTGTAEVSRAAFSARVASVPRSATAAASRWVSKPAGGLGCRARVRSELSIRRRRASASARPRGGDAGALPLSRRSVRRLGQNRHRDPLPASAAQPRRRAPSLIYQVSSISSSRSSVSTSSSILRSSSSGTWTVNRMPARSNSTSLC